jgi:hypothetical protein
MARSKKSERPYLAIVWTLVLLMWTVVMVTDVVHPDEGTLDAWLTAGDGVVVGLVLTIAVQDWRRYLRSWHADRRSRQART